MGNTDRAEIAVAKTSVKPANSRILFSMVVKSPLSFLKSGLRTQGQSRIAISCGGENLTHFRESEQIQPAILENHDQEAAGRLFQVVSSGMLSFDGDSVYDPKCGMKGAKSNADLDRSAAPDLWRHTLSQVPSVFGRLAYLASLRNVNSGRYEHHGLALVHGEKEANQAIKDSHLQTFAEWLNLSLSQQKGDLEVYFSGLAEDAHTVLEAWLEIPTYENLMPVAARAVEKRLYLSDWKAIISLLKFECGAAGPDRDA
jgi:hypothetical protein